MRVWIEADIRRGGFSSERYFEVKDINGQLICGLANEQYMLNNDWQPLPEPTVDEITRGLVECRVIHTTGQSAIIELPAIPEAGTGGQLLVDTCKLLRRSTAAKSCHSNIAPFCGPQLSTH